MQIVALSSKKKVTLGSYPQGGGGGGGSRKHCAPIIESLSLQDSEANFLTVRNLIPHTGGAVSPQTTSLV